MRLSLIFMLALLPLSSIAATMDSLRTALQRTDLGEEERIDLSLSLARKYLGNDYLRAEEMADSIYPQAKPYPALLARAIIVKAQAIGGVANSDSALVVLEEAFRVITLQTEPRVYARVLDVKGLLISRKGDFIPAKRCFERVIEIADSIGHDGRKAASLTNLAAVYGNLGQRNEASKLYFEALQLAEASQNLGAAATALSNIGIAYHQKNRLDTARYYYELAMEKFEAKEEKAGQAQMLRYIGVTLHGQGNIDTAQALYERSLQLAVEINSITDIVDSKSRLGELAQHNKDFALADKLFKEVFELVQAANMKRESASAASQIGDNYGWQGKIKEAIEWCKIALQIADEIGSKKYQQSACYCLNQGYREVGDFENAYLIQERLIGFLKAEKEEKALLSLQQLEFERQSLQDSLRVADEKQRAELEHQAEISRKNNARNVAMAGGGIVVLLALGLWSRLRYTRRMKTIIEREKDRSDELLLNILPSEVAEELKDTGASEAQLIEQVTVLFTDFKGFTAMSESLSPKALVDDLNECFSEFDRITAKYGIEKIKTIGDAYMAAGGLPLPDKNHAQNVVKAALEMRDFVEAGKTVKSAAGLPYFEIRIGIHTGPVVAGIVGVKKFQYDIWGDTVNTASRMESSGEVGKVNISQATYEHLMSNDNHFASGDASTPLGLRSEFAFENRGKIEAKGKGEMEMLFVDRKKKDTK